MIDKTDSEAIRRAKEAGPELLEALQACVDYIEGLRLQTRSMNTALRIDDFLTGTDAPDIYAAIAKATGKFVEDV